MVDYDNYNTNDAASGGKGRSVGKIVAIIAVVCLVLLFLLFRYLEDRASIDDFDSILSSNSEQGITFDWPSGSETTYSVSDGDPGWAVGPDVTDDVSDVVPLVGFTSTRTTPLSTVSADVDTASYTIIRSMLNNGRYIDKDQVRIEEMINYFDYDYDKPKNGLFSMNTAVMDCPWHDGAKLVSLGFATSPYYTFAEDNGSNIVFLVDVSGSMADSDKLDLFKDSFREFAKDSPFDASDIISVATYASEETVVLDGVSGADMKQVSAAINSLVADGSTNGERGLDIAYELAKKHYIDGGVNTIVMVTDGDLNVGIQTEDELFDYVSKRHDEGIDLSVLGFGLDGINDVSMETLADNGNGSYHYIDCVEEARKVLVDDVMANFIPLAKDVKVQVEFNPEKIKGYTMIGYANRRLADSDFKDDTVDAGEVGPGHQFTVLYEVLPADSDEAVIDGEASDPELIRGEFGDADWLRASLRYMPVDTDAVESYDVMVDDSIDGIDNDNIKMQAAVAEFGLLASESELAGTSSVDGIRKLLADAIMQPSWNGFLDVVDRYEGIM